MPPTAGQPPSDQTAGDAADPDSVVLRGRDISAWVEVPFDGYGWVAFDPSPPPYPTLSLMPGA